VSLSSQGIVIPGEADAHKWLQDGDGALADAVSRTQRDSNGAVWQFGLDQHNVYRVESLYQLSRDLGALLRISLMPEAGLDAGAQMFLEDFVRYKLLPDPVRSAEWHLEDLKLLLATAGEKRSAWSLQLKALSRIVYRGVRALFREAFWRCPARPEQADRIECPLLIGAYGGEHAGDAAILGGILLDLHAMHGTRRALLGSFRPAHTARLVQSLDVPVEVRVFDYEPAGAEEQLGSADALVFAGGPLMDLPELLVKHWNVALKARNLGLPFIMDRIGVGPFARRPSRYVARRIARLATSLSVRTSGAARQPELRGLDARVENDPAFTYLESRGPDLSALSMLRSRDRREVDSLLRGAENKFKVGINLRPMRHLWSPRGETSSRRAEAQCLEGIAEALALVGQKIPTRYVFFPMNPIQLGGSDLLSAWQLHKLLGRDVDFQVWQGDPEIDGLLYLLRRLDAAVTMRFHACIFALSQGLPTLGIDYYPHAGGKVEELFADRALPGNVTRVDILEARWLADKLEGIASA